MNERSNKIQALFQVILKTFFREPRTENQEPRTDGEKKKKKIGVARAFAVEFWKTLYDEVVPGSFKCTTAYNKGSSIRLNIPERKFVFFSFYSILQQYFYMSFSILNN